MQTVRDSKNVTSTEDSVTMTRAELKSLLACAWDDGYGCGFDDADDDVLVEVSHDNPYRSS